MSFSVIPSDRFKREAKRLIKKFPSLKQELAALGALLQKTTGAGTPLGNDTYKIRIAVKSKGDSLPGDTAEGSLPANHLR